MLMTIFRSDFKIHRVWVDDAVPKRLRRGFRLGKRTLETSFIRFRLFTKDSNAREHYGMDEILSHFYVLHKIETLFIFAEVGAKEFPISVLLWCTNLMNQKFSAPSQHERCLAKDLSHDLNLPISSCFLVKLFVRNPKLHSIETNLDHTE